MSNTCIKHRFASKKEAESAAKALKDRKLRAYLCPSCGEWHFGHGELGRRSSYKFSLNRQYVGRSYHDHLDQVFSQITNRPAVGH